MNKIVKSIYKGMMGSQTELFLLKFVIMHQRKDERWDLLRKIHLIGHDKILKKLEKMG